MQIAVLGTGNVGDTIGSKLIEVGHTVKMGSRTTDNEKAKVFMAKHNGKASAGTFADAAAFGEIIFNCTAGVGSIEALKMAGEKNLAGKIIVDIANPLDFSKGMPPSLAICNTHSLGEEIQNAFPETKVVKALNTMWCGLMVNPGMINGGDHSTFISGNDADAKEKVKAILKSFGWLEKNILDLGDIAKARGTEMYLPLWLNIYGATNNGAFNIKIVG
jgi:8-hydroxy-5-deazaflavin:NADPH oxidoreductase